MSARREGIWVWLVAGVALLLLSLPYIYAWLAADVEHAFGGFLINPLDGNSYLAKMRQGLGGAWAFWLPYTAEPGEGAALNLYYLFLGHVARWTGASLIFIFHAARLAGGALMLAALYRLFAALFEDARSRLAAFSLAALGSGLGWVALLAGGFTPDFWLAEAFPFLAAYANPHFALGLALQIGLLIPLASSHFGWRHWLGYPLAAGLLAVIYPFGLVVAGAVLALCWTGLAARQQPSAAESRRLLAVGLGGLPYAAYAWWLVRQHPVLAAWDAQNQTPTPSPLELLVALSPALLFALLGFYTAARKPSHTDSLLATWLLVTLVLIYLPLDLQRRLSSGLFVAVAGLAVLGLEQLSRGWQRWRGLGLALILVSWPTNLLILTGGLGAAAENHSDLYLYRDELSAFEWLGGEADEGALVLAAPRTGNYLPAYAAVRVLYGHPFESVEAEEQRQAVEDFYAGASGLDWLEDSGVDYIFYGQHEQALGPLAELVGWQLVYQQGAVQIWGPDG